MVEKRILVQDRVVRYTVTDHFSPLSPIVFLHGWKQDSSTFLPVMEHLERIGHSCISLDFPGFGETLRPSATWGVYEYALFLRDFLTKHTIHDPLFVGHSFGGRIAIMFHTIPDIPPPSKKLILIGTAGIRPVISKKRKYLLSVGKKIFSFPWFQSLGEMIREQMNSRDYREAGNMRDIFLKVVSEDIKDRFSEIRVPTLLLWGELDTETPLSDAHFIHDAIVGSLLETFPQGTHFIYREYPKEIAESIDHFIREV